MKIGKLAVICASVLLLASCVHKNNQHSEVSPLRVKTMIVAPQTSLATSRYVGAVEPVRETPLSLQSAGRVVSIEVKNGQHVRAGQTILSIDNTQALNALRSAEASLHHAQDGYDRVKKVHSKGVVSDQKMVEIESQLSQAKSLYSAAKQQLNECTLKAPCNGVVDGLKVEKGQTIIPGTKVCSLLDVSAFNVRFTVPEGEIREIEKGGKLQGTVKCSAVDTVLPIIVTEKSVTANPVTHTYDVVAQIQGGAEVLMTGMVAVARLQTNATQAESKNEIIIPAKCVLLQPEGPTVWVIEQGKATRKDITTDGYLSSGVRVSSGLTAGDTLIIDGYQKLYKGCKVIIVD